MSDALGNLLKGREKRRSLVQLQQNPYFLKLEIFYEVYTPRPLVNWYRKAVELEELA